jgi:hypothetical protein
MRNILRSNWTIPPLLAALNGYDRTDDGTDLRAFRVVGEDPQRSAYVYLYGEDPDLIHFDLEDESVETGEWDHAVRRGSVRSVDDLRTVVAAWLAGK